MRLLPKFVMFPECAVRMKNFTNKSATEIQEHGNCLFCCCCCCFFIIIIILVGEGARVLLLLRFVSAFSQFELGVAMPGKSSLELGTIGTALALLKSR